jgi:hypothetical protein
MKQELKEQAHKEFDELWKELRMKDNTSFEEIPADTQFKKLIDSLIDKTVQYEQDRIAQKVNAQLEVFFDWAEQVKAKEIGHWVMMYGISPQEFRKSVLSLITNKSDINKDTL